MNADRASELRVVRVESPLVAARARHLLRSRLSGEHPATALLTPSTMFEVVGEVHDPDLTLRGLAPSPSGSVGGFRWRAPLATRPLRGSIVDLPAGGSLLEARFRTDRLYATREVRALEARLAEWLRDALQVRPA